MLWAKVYIVPVVNMHVEEGPEHHNILPLTEGNQL